MQHIMSENDLCRRETTLCYYATVCLIMSSYVVLCRLMSSYVVVLYHKIFSFFT